MKDSNNTAKRKVLPRLVAATVTDSPKAQLLEELRQALRSRDYDRRTERSYCHWIIRYIYFHDLRHPAEMAEAEVNAFLTHLWVKEKVGASTQNEALSALLFLYRHVIGRDVGSGIKVVRARKSKRSLEESKQ